MNRPQPQRANLMALATLAVTLLATPLAVAEPGDNLTIYALTFGPGDHPFFKFGHNAILVQPQTGQGLVYNFGTFAFDSPALIPKFLRGRFMYWLSVAGVEETVHYYASSNRSIVAQELDLTPAQRLALVQALRWNARPENREYLYDYFYDNCSTRVRDAIDRVVGGRVRAAGQAPADRTFRDHAVRMTADLWPEAVGIDMGLGPSADRPIDRWAESFLPERLKALLATVRVPDGTGGEKNLVKSEKTIFQDVRPPKPAQPPNWTLYFLLVGVAVGGGTAALGRLGTVSVARVLLGSIAAAIGLVLGLLGLCLTLLWLFTNHKIVYANANIAQFAPWSVALLVFGIGAALGRPRATRRAAWLALSAVVSSGIGILLKALPGVGQSNWPFIVFCLPVWTGLWLGLRSLASACQPAGTNEHDAAGSPALASRRSRAGAKGSESIGD